MTTARIIENLEKSYPEMFHPNYGAKKKLKRVPRNHISRIAHANDSFSNVVFAIHALRCNVKSLSAEAKLIRYEEKRAGLVYCSALREHRVRELREESRYSLLALAFYRGKPRSCVEPGANSPIDFFRLRKKVSKYGIITDRCLMEWIVK